MGGVVVRRGDDFAGIDLAVVVEILDEVNLDAGVQAADGDGKVSGASDRESVEVAGVGAADGAGDGGGGAERTEVARGGERVAGVGRGREEDARLERFEWAENRGRGRC